MESTLILNASTEPLEVVSARRAIQLILAGKALSVDDSDKFIHSADDIMVLPYVVQLLEQRHIKRSPLRWGNVGFSKRGVLARDNFRCVYCGKKGSTIDHIVPQALGGPTSYANCVTACESCNSKKGCRTIEQLGWNVPGIEYRDMTSPYYQLLLKTKQSTPQWDSWKPYVEMWSGSKLMKFA